MCNGIHVFVLLMFFHVDRGFKCQFIVHYVSDAYLQLVFMRFTYINHLNILVDFEDTGEANDQ